MPSGQVQLDDVFTLGGFGLELALDSFVFEIVLLGYLTAGIFWFLLWQYCRNRFRFAHLSLLRLHGYHRFQRQHQLAAFSRSS